MWRENRFEVNKLGLHLTPLLSLFLNWRKSQNCRLSRQKRNPSFLQPQNVFFMILADC